MFLPHSLTLFIFIMFFLLVLVNSVARVLDCDASVGRTPGSTPAECLHGPLILGPGLGAVALLGSVVMLLIYLLVIPSCSQY